MEPLKWMPKLYLEKPPTGQMGYLRRGFSPTKIYLEEVEVWDVELFFVFLAALSISKKT
jgi:hypothetical protein